MFDIVLGGYTPLMYLIMYGGQHKEALSGSVYVLLQAKANVALAL